jgi:hypothetical protein
MAYRGVNPNGPFTYPNGAAAIAANLLVTLDSSGNLIVATATDSGVGFTNDTIPALTQKGQVFPNRGKGVLTSSAAIAVGDLVKSAAAGKIAPEAIVTTSTVNTIGRALSAASGADKLVKVAFLT